MTGVAAVSASLMPRYPSRPCRFGLHAEPIENRAPSCCRRCQDVRRLRVEAGGDLQQSQAEVRRTLSWFRTAARRLAHQFPFEVCGAAVRAWVRKGVSCRAALLEIERKTIADPIKVTDPVFQFDRKHALWNDGVIDGWCQSLMRASRRSAEPTSERIRSMAVLSMASNTIVDAAASRAA